MSTTPDVNMTVVFISSSATMISHICCYI